MVEMTDPRERLIVALDAGWDESFALARSLAGTVRWLKVGMTLFYERGPAAVEDLRDEGFDVFLDLKLHDIPHQVRGAAESVARLGARMLTVHASGGSEMVAAAVEGASRGAAAAGVAAPSVIAVTVLTSMDERALASVGVGDPAHEQVGRLARLTRAAGAAGLVCSPLEAQGMRDAWPEALIVTPGVRPAWSGSDDQARIATPRSALDAGASHLVVGRPVTCAADPVAAARKILDEMGAVR